MRNHQKKTNNNHMSQRCPELDIKVSDKIHEAYSSTVCPNDQASVDVWLKGFWERAIKWAAEAYADSLEEDKKEEETKAEDKDKN
ncbi:MAG: hypothetical protein EHM41_00835 [Chloroflexi bacterium]|nr:MAG: hypothetical protein EHM41_00835 [Chloroflexota bacterium]